VRPPTTDPGYRRAVSRARRSLRSLAVAVAVVVILVAVTAVSCSRVGDDRFQKLPDAARPDAPDFVPDAGGPADAVSVPDAAVDAAPDAP